MRAFNKRSVFLAAFLIFAGFNVFALAQEVSKETEQAMNAGLDAAKREDWDLAVKQFSEAQKIAPTSPQILFNLALAYDKAGDKELVALALYEAYMIAAPEAVNSQTIKARIEELDTQIKTNIRSLILSAQKAAAAIPDDVFTYSSAGVSQEVKLPYLKNVYQSIADAQSDLGDFPGARATLAKVRDLQDAIQSLPGSHDATDYNYLALKQSLAGDISAALKSVALIQDEKNGEWWRGMSYKSIVNAQIEQGDIAGAQKTEKLITHQYFKDLAKQCFVKEKLKAGDIPAAISLASGIQSDTVRAYAYLDIAHLELEKKDASGALKSLNEAYQATNFLKDYDGGHRPTLYYSIAEAQSKAGDTDAALKTLAQAEKKDADTPGEYSSKNWDYWIRAEITQKSGDLKKAKDLLAQAKEWLQKFPYSKSHDFYAYGSIARMQSATGDAEGARKTIAEATKIVSEGNKSDGGASAYLDLGRGWGDMKSAKVIFLANFASSFRVGFGSSSPLLSNWPGWQKFMQSQKENKNIDDEVENLANAAKYLSEALKRIRTASIP